MKKLLTLGLAVASAVTMMACGGKQAEKKPADAAPAAGAAPAAEMPMIGVTIYKYDDNFMSFVRRAIETLSAGKATLSMNDSQNDQAKQNNQVDTMIAKGAKSLAINLVDPQAAATVISKAKTANLPVVFFNKEPKADVLAACDKCWYVGTKSEESGILQGQLIAKEWAANKAKWDKNKDGKIQMVILKGEPGHPDAEARTTFMHEELKKAGLDVEVLEVQTAMWDTAKANNLMDAWQAKHGDKIEFVVANNDGMAMGALNSLQAKGYFKDGKFMPVVGVDAIPDALAKIKSGEMVGTVLNDAKNQGKATFELALNAATGKDPLAGTSWKLDGKAVRVPYVIVTKDNLQVGEDAYK